MYTLVKRVVASSFLPLTELLEETNQVVWLSKTQPLKRCCVKGVPLNKLDVLWDGSSEGWLDVGFRHGTFDKKESDRITIRALPKVDGKPVKHEAPLGEISTHVEDGRRLVEVFVADSVTWRKDYHILRTGVNCDTPAKIVMWHYGRFFRHLAKEHHKDVVLVADAWQPQSETLAAQNREAERLLYSLSKELGWVKLPKRVRDHIGIPPVHSKQWYKREQVDEIRLHPNRMGELLGISEASVSGT